MFDNIEVITWHSVFDDDWYIECIAKDVGLVYGIGECGGVLVGSVYPVEDEFTATDIPILERSLL